MASRRSEPLYSIEEYLALERAAEERHEYIDGYIYAMAGESESTPTSEPIWRETQPSVAGSPSAHK